MKTYVENFDQGPGGWFGWINNAYGPKRLETKDGALISRSPWWIDYNHAPPGAGYMHLLYILLTSGPFNEHYREIGGLNRFVDEGCPTDIRDATITLRLKGELEDRGARMHLLVQAKHDGICSGWLLTSQPIDVTPDWSRQSVHCLADEAQWKCLGSRHDRADFYGRLPLERVLGDANCDILLVLYPLQIVPMGPLDGDPHRLRPEQDYPVWRSRLPEGYVLLDEVRLEFRE